MHKKLIKIFSLAIATSLLFSLTGCTINIDKDLAERIVDESSKVRDEDSDRDSDKDSNEESDEEIANPDNSDSNDSSETSSINPNDTLVGTGSMEDQIACIVANRSVWEITESNGSDRYAITDLDNDTHYEIVCITNGGSGNYTYTRIYEVNNECSGISLMAEFAPNLTGETTPGVLAEIDWLSGDINYSRLSNGTYYYEMFNAWSAGTAAGFGSQTVIVSFGTSGVATDALASYENRNGETLFYDAAGIEISEYDYETAFDVIMLEGDPFGSVHIEYTISFDEYSPFTDVSDSELTDMLTASANSFEFFVG